MSGYYRFPTIHADSIVFNCEDDLWSVPSSGGIARRLTSNLGEATRPWFSPDGKILAFVGREEGQPEIFTIPAEGGPAQRMTYLAGSLCLTAGWSPDGKLLFANNAGHWYLRFTHLYTLEPAGGPPERLPLGLARAIAYGPNGGLVIGRNTDDPARWKRYRGGTAGQLWIDESGQESFHPLLKLNSNLSSPLWLGEPGTLGRIYFISDHEGVGNLYSTLPSGEDLQRHTRHSDYYVRNANSDGRRIVYHAGADLYLFDPANGESRLVPVELHSPRTQRNRKYVDAGRYLQEVELHPQGQTVALTSRGKLFSFANWEGAVTPYGSSSEMEAPEHPQTAIRYRLPAWLNDGKRLLAVSDEGGEEHFLIFNCREDPTPGEVLDGLDIGRPEAIAVNPVKDQILFSNHRYELLFLDLATRELLVIDRGQANPIRGFAWSPDGEWAAYSVSISLQTQALKLWKTSNRETSLLTQPVLRDVQPAFDPKGKYLYFLSYRSFEPVYDHLHFDLSFPVGMKPYLITLQKNLPSPFIPQPRLEDDGCEPKEEEGEQGPEEQTPPVEQPNPVADNTPAIETDTVAPAESEAVPSETPAGDHAPKPAESKPGPAPLVIDLEGIQERILAFPVQDGIYGRILGLENGKVLYSRYPIQSALDPDPPDGPPAHGSLWVYNFEEQKEERLTNGLTDFQLSRNNKWLLYRSGNRLRALKSGEKPANDGEGASRKTGWLDLGRVKVAVLPGAEWRQMFREAWRLQRDQFWTENMSEVDWLAVHNRYLPLVDRLSSRAEFSDLMWEMQGELGTSHAYEFGGDYRPQPFYHPGFLGADFAFDSEKQGWRVVHLLKGDSWNQEAESPLRQAGVNIQEGDILLAANGRRLGKMLPPGAALINQAGNEVTLSILPASGGPARLVTVKTLGNENALRYREWVENNRQAVHQATGGQVGYLHIPDMMGAGYAEFHRGYLAEVDRPGLIIDVRFNRGGHVSPLLLEKLARRRLGYDQSRWSQFLNPYPPESVLGPMVALTNEFAGSDGDMFCHAFKLMGLGPLIGVRTWGGVIGIEPRHSLVDGTITTQPEYSFWFKDVGWGVENYGTDPDIEVDILPQDYAHAADPQLERAIEVITRQMQENPPALPDLTQRPSRALPRLD